MSDPGLIHLIDTLPDPAERGDRNTIGGWPLLTAGEPWPACHCGTRMVFFFQVEIPAGVPHFGGDHLLAFQCPVHDDVPGPPGEDTFWRILIRPAGEPAPDEDPFVESHRLHVRQDTEVVDGVRGRQGFKIGGVPSWAQYPEQHRCACGTDMVFLAQVPENWGFDMWPMKDEDEQAHLFLGNEIYILACPARCHPEATWPIPQN